MTGSFFRVVEKEEGFGVSQVMRSWRVPEVFEPVFYLSGEAGVGYPRIVFELPFSNVHEMATFFQRNTDVSKKFSRAVEDFLSVLREIRSLVGDSEDGDSHDAGSSGA